MAHHGKEIAFEPIVVDEPPVHLLKVALLLLKRPIGLGKRFRALFHLLFQPVVHVRQLRP